MKGSDHVARFLAARGVTHVFELVGGMITHLLDSLHREGRVEIVSLRHEQAAAFAADAYGRVTGVPGVAMATSGPGATNLITGIGSAFFDSSPAVFITGQVNRAELRGDRPIRQLGFQETDIVEIAGPLTKGARRVMAVEDLPGALDWAFELALEGRRGPVLLDLPMDVQGAMLDAPDPAPASSPAPPAPDPADVARIVELLDRHERPLLLAGAGVRSAAATDALARFATATGMPVVHSLLGVDAIAYDHPSHVGLIGSYGNRWANTAIGHADLLLVVGSRLDIRQTGADVDAFRGERVVVHVDVDPGEINNRVLRSEAVHADARALLEALDAALGDRRADRFEGWRAEIAGLRERWPDVAELPDVRGINPNQLMHELSRASGAAAGYVVDVGQHQQWAAQSLELREGQRFLTSGGMGAMGFALPAAIGAVCGAPRAPWVVIAGDGGLQLNIQELQSVAHGSLPLKLVVVDNECHGMVRQFQETYFDGRYQSTMWGYSAPDFVAVAAAYGIEAASVSDPAEVADGLARLWAHPDRPFLLRVAVDPMANAYPKLAFGRPITEMEPFAQPIAMEGT